MRVRGLAALAAALLGGCSQAARDEVDDGSALVAQAAKVDEADFQALADQATNAEYPVYLSLMRTSGLEADLGGPLPAENALHALMGHWRDRAQGARGELPRLFEAAGGEASSYGMTGLAVSTLLGTTTGMLASSIEGNRTINLDRSGGSARIDLKGDKISTHAEVVGDIEGGLTGAVVTDIEYDRCPDAEGKVRIRFSSMSGLARKGGGGSGGRLQLTVEMTRHYDDNAELGEILSMETKIDHAAIGANGKESGFVKARWKGGTQGAEAPSITAGPGADDATMRAVADQKQMAELMAASILQQASAGVKGGQCVLLKATSNPGGRSGVKSSTPFSILAEPRSKLDGKPVGGIVTATLSGKGALDPAGSPVDADATFAYKAPDKENEQGTVLMVARSKRGIGKAALDFDTRQTMAFFADGGLDAYHGTGTICDFSKPFVISGTGVTNNFTPNGPTSGTYKYSGAISGIAVWGGGTYRVELDADGKGGTMKASGPGSVKGPTGVATANGTEVYKLTPVPPCK